MTKLDWEKDRRKRLKTERGPIPPERPAAGVRDGPPRDQTVILKEIRALTKEIKDLSSVQAPAEKLKSLIGECKRLINSYVVKTGRGTTEISNARTVIANVQEGLRRKGSKSLRVRVPGAASRNRSRSVKRKYRNSR